MLIGSLDQASADELLSRMDADTAQGVRNAIMELGEVSQAEEAEVLEAFFDTQPGGARDDEPGIELEASLLAQFASEPEDSPVAPPTDATEETELFCFLHEATIESLVSHLRSEHPQVIAVVAAHLPAPRAADLLKHLTPPVQADVLRRVAELDRSDTTAILDLEQWLRATLADDIRAARNRSSGVAAVASILRAAGSEQQQLHDNVRQFDKDLAHWLSSRSEPDSPQTVGADEDAAAPTSPRVTSTRIATPLPREPAVPVAESFVKIWQRPEKELADLLHHVPKDLLFLALAGAPPLLLKQVLRPIAGRKAREFTRQMNRLGPVRLSDIEEAQRRIVELANHLHEEGASQANNPAQLNTATTKFVAAA